MEKILCDFVLGIARGISIIWQICLRNHYMQKFQGIDEFCKDFNLVKKRLELFYIYYAN